MALNPFFVHGTRNEQGLIQGLINEQIRMYGIDVVYIPRKFVRKETILKEVSSSKFNNAFSIEVYLENYDGYSGQGDILTKFGMSLKDEVTLCVSRERFDNFIVPFLRNEDPEEIELYNRPREGDLVYFPLGKRLFEVKFVEHEDPFYQLGKLYVYQLKCELFEYEDEVIETSLNEVDTRVQDEGYIATVNLTSLGSTATASATINTGYIRKIYLNNDGYSYTSPPTVIFSPAPPGGVTAKGVAITQETNTVTRSVKEILLTHAGIGYTEIPTITISGGGGTGAAATCSIELVKKGIVEFNVSNIGEGYNTKPIITISGPSGIGETAVGIASLSGNAEVASIRIVNPGVGYTMPPIVTIAPPSVISGFGTYLFNEIVTGSLSGITARVKSWDATINVLKVSFINVTDTSMGFYPGEIIVGTISSAVYAVSSFDSWNYYDKYSDNVTIQTEADQIIDKSESNPFGIY